MEIKNLMSWLKNWLYTEENKCRKLENGSATERVIEAKIWKRVKDIEEWENLTCV